MTIDESENPPRLIMEKMVLENFKSYANRITIGPFHKSFTSIVGANGSGKSNVIDALLFVFGFKAKKMRQEKLSGLIHHSKDYPSLEYCTVEVHFKEIIDRDDGGFDEVEGSELVISRRATKSNTSQYYINGSGSTYTEVTNLLKNKGVDLEHKRFLILQGEVESISQMKPKGVTEHDEGLLEYLEDIIGTSQYKEPISQSLSEMETLNELRAEKLNRIKLAEGDVKALESQKKEAEDYLEDENNLVRLKNKLYQYSLWESKERLEHLESESSEAQKALADYDEKLASESEGIKEVQDQYKELERAYMAAKQQSSVSEKEYAKYERDFIQLEEKKKHLKGKKKKLEKAIEKDIHSRSESDTWLNNHRNDLEKKNRVLEKYGETMKQAEDDLNQIRKELNGKTDGIQKDLDNKKDELAPWLEKINEKRSEINIKKSEIELLQEKANSEEKSRENVENMHKECQSNLKTKQKELKDSSDELKRLHSDLKKAESDLADFQEQEVSLRAAVVELSQQLEGSKSSAQAASKRSELVKVLFAEKNAGRISGIHGSLSELGSIDDKYDVAISSAYSERLKWIVVDTVQTAEKCLKVLKSKNAGRASFIVLERIDEAPKSTPTPENAARLVDLIKPVKPEFKKAFYYVVRETLVATDLDQANRIAFGKQRWKVVTLDGKVIDKAGTMSGGGQKVSKGALSKSVAVEVRPEDIQNMTDLKAQRERELKDCRSEIDRLKKQVDQLFKKLGPLEIKRAELETDCDSLEQEIASLKKSLAAPKKSSGLDKSEAKELEKLEADVESLEADEEKLVKKASKIQDEIAKLQNKILEVGGDKLRRQNAKVKDLQDEIELLQESIAHIESQLKTTEKSHGKASGGITKSENELKQTTEELEEIEELLQEKTTAASEIKKKAENSKDSVETQKDQLDEMKRTLDERSKTLNMLRSEKIEIESNASDVIKAYNDLKKRVVAWTQALKSLKIQTITGHSDSNQELQVYEDEALEGLKKEHIVREITVLEEKISEAKPNLAVLEEYRERYNEYMSRVRDMEEITAQRDKAKQTYDDLRKRRFDEFMAGFTKISQKLKEMYQMITLGGNAELELVDSLDPFSEGIMFSVMPPKKSWKNISNLSGGEKTLSSLALVFALHHFKPTPLYVMDEIDAALDFRNVSIIANYIKDRTKNAQFVIISLRNNMFELADRLVGIYKTQNTTKSITINPNAVAVNAQ